MAKSESEKIYDKKNENLNRTVQEQDVAERNQAYNEYVKQVTPTHNLVLKMLKAFVTGGIICCIGQVILNIAQNAGLDKDTSGGWCSMILVLMSVILTGLNIYPSIAKFGGAGALVPITGFANSVAAPAIEFKKGRSGLWDWLQNFYHCGSGNPLWNLYKLATWGHILDISADSEVNWAKSFKNKRILPKRSRKRETSPRKRSRVRW